jgi:hypothetical protein
MNLNLVLSRAALAGSVLLVSLAAIVLVASTTAAGRRLIVRTLVAHSGYMTGEREAFPAGTVGQGPVTVILFAEGTCGACEKTVPFLKILKEGLEPFVGASIRFFVATGGGGVTTKDTELAEAIGISAPVPVALQSVRLRAIPTLLVVNRKGRILFVQEGAPRPGSERSVHDSIIAAVARGSSQ